VNATNIVRWANQLGIVLSISNAVIRYSPASLAPEDLVRALREHKGELISILLFASASDLHRSPLSPSILLLNLPVLQTQTAGR